MKCLIKILNANKINNNENTNILFNKISTRADFTDISSIYNDINRLNEGDKNTGCYTAGPLQSETLILFRHNLLS